ncbi:MAG: M13 family metallopeptidase [Thermodesulfobacteriota bacterium]|nr:M13 family metallopeptidase [Thermodesulfobacteriota bacterium]
MPKKTFSSFYCSLLFCSLLIPGVSSQAGSIPKHKHHDNPSAHARAMTHSPEGSLGFSVDKIDTSVDPGSDFYRFAGGRWLDSAKIPDTEVAVGQLDGLGHVIGGQILTLLETAAASSAKASKGSVEQQVGDFYASSMDTDRLEKLGFSPIKPELARIDNMHSMSQLPAQLAHMQTRTGNFIFLISAITPDDHKSDVNVLKIFPGPVHLGGRDSYLKEEKSGQRTAYKAYISELLQLIGVPEDDATAQSETILAMETKLIAGKMTPVESKDPNTKYNKMSPADLQKTLPGFDLSSYFRELRITSPETLIVPDTKYVQSLGRLLQESSLEDIKTYLRFCLVNSAAESLSEDFLDLNHNFFLKTLNGIKKFKPRNEFMATSLRGAFGHPVAQLYVKEYFSPESKKQVEDMVLHIREEFADRLKNNQWLDDKTRDSALKKLTAMEIKVGYPEKWIDYSGVDIRRDDFYGNLMRLSAFGTRRNLDRLGQPVVTDGFSVSGVTLPTDVNAAYSPQNNHIEISAAILQPPFFFTDLDPAVNFGAIGAVIGHEITHGFDSSGRQYDASGELNNWWTDKDAEEFTKKAKVLIKQYDGYEALPGLHVNGTLCVTENIADLGGVTLAHAALQRSLKGNPQTEKIDGYTPDQRFFLSWAHLWMSKYRPEIVKILVEGDSHPPSRFRVTGPMVHQDSFYKAFEITEKDPMWLPEKDRLTIW